MLLQKVSDELIEEIIKSHPTLKSLNLSNNQINGLEFVRKLPILNKLDVSFNQIRFLPSDFVLYSHQLIVLNLNNNGMYVSNLVIRTSITLARFFPDRANLRPLRACNSLKQLQIAHNAVSVFEQLYHLQDLKSLQILEAHSNPIAAIEKLYRNKTIQVLPQLQVLDNKLLH